MLLDMLAYKYPNPRFENSKIHHSSVEKVKEFCDMSERETENILVKIYLRYKCIFT